MPKKYEYIVSEDGIIYRYSKHSGMKEVVKKQSTNGRGLVFRHKGHVISYSNFVARALIPNPKNCNLVFHADGDYFNTHPSNLRWVWTRHKRKLTINEALEKTDDNRLIDFYKTGNEEIVKNAIAKISYRFKPELIGELYLRLMNYASRNLLFNIEKDAAITHCGMIKQSRIDSLRTVEYNDCIDYSEFNPLT